MSIRIMDLLYRDIYGGYLPLDIIPAKAGIQRYTL